MRSWDLCIWITTLAHSYAYVVFLTLYMRVMLHTLIATHKILAGDMVYIFHLWCGWIPQHVAIDIITILPLCLDAAILLRV